MKNDYQPFINYFNKKRFGSEMPVLTILSYLPTSDRCSILSQLVMLDPNNVEIYNKYSMALMKNGNYQEARQLLDNALNKGKLDRSNYSALKEKIEFLHQQRGSNFGSTTDYHQTLDLIENSKDQLKNMGMTAMYREFVQIITNFCNEH